MNIKNLLWVLCFLGSLAVGEVQAGTITFSVTESPITGGGVGITSNDPVFFVDDANSEFGFASLPALGVFSRYGDELIEDPVGTGGFSVGSSYILSGVVFSSSTPGTTFTDVFFGGRLVAHLFGTSHPFGPAPLGGVQSSLSVVLRISYNFPGFPVVFDKRTVFSTTVEAVDPGTSYDIQIDQIVGATFSIPVGASIQIEASLGVLAGLTNNNGFAVADAGNSLTFNPNAYFGLEPGVTANDGEFIVDNQLPGTTAAVPEPSSLVLLMTGIAGLFGYGWRTRRKQEAA